MERHLFRGVTGSLEESKGTAPAADPHPRLGDGPRRSARGCAPAGETDPHHLEPRHGRLPAAPYAGLERRTKGLPGGVRPERPVSRVHVLGSYPFLAML